MSINQPRTRSHCQRTKIAAVIHKITLRLYAPCRWSTRRCKATSVSVGHSRYWTVRSLRCLLSEKNSLWSLDALSVRIQIRNDAVQRIDRLHNDWEDIPSIYDGEKIIYSIHIDLRDKRIDDSGCSKFCCPNFETPTPMISVLVSLRVNHHNLTADENMHSQSGSFTSSLVIARICSS